ncbi:MAG: spore coat U domain-containing protein [Sulfuricaulis sp.]|uniref:spore coat protein U domain-containing protein n=1 Tax=Sulfuricaulis sp. TaxID=2003553 RepID=UPI0025D16456|nr:spore coat protein U domain-containing protein [Sulfuricaulis sp.]MCR4347462.1 spore coat U domain-containing protein [Sulfuricaulis sp.]
MKSIMKNKLSMAMVALCATGIIGSTGALADTASVAVSAKVIGHCAFNVSNGVVAFGDLNPGTPGDVTGTVTQPTFWCTKNATWGITDNDGVNASEGAQRMKHASLAEYIPYSFSYTIGGSGTGKNTPITMDIASTVLNADFLDASEGNYADTVTLTITP